MSSAHSRDRIQSIERGLLVLEAFGPADSSLGVSELAARVGLPRPVVRRILLTYSHLGYVTSQDGHWRLSPRVLELSSRYFTAASLPELAHETMVEVAERTEETCSVEVLDGHEVVHVGRVEKTRLLPPSVRIGSRLPPHATASGIVLLAGLREDELAQLQEQFSLIRFTPFTLTDSSKLSDRITAARDRGYDISAEELHSGLLSVAVPIQVDDTLVGSLSLSSTTSRQGEDNMLNIVRNVLWGAADQVGQYYKKANPERFK